MNITFKALENQDYRNIFRNISIFQNINWNDLKKEQALYILIAIQVMILIIISSFLLPFIHKLYVWIKNNLHCRSECRHCNHKFHDGNICNHVIETNRKPVYGTKKVIKEEDVKYIDSYENKKVTKYKQIPYTVEESYYEQIPYQDQEEYMDREEYTDTETYTDRESYQETEYESVREPYTKTESYSEYVSYPRSQYNFSTKNWDNWSERKLEYKTRNVTDYKYVQRPKTVTKYKNVTKTRNVTKYKPVKKTRTVTKYKNDTKISKRTVTKYKSEAYECMEKVPIYKTKTEKKYVDEQYVIKYENVYKYCQCYLDDCASGTCDCHKCESDKYIQKCIINLIFFGSGMCWCFIGALLIAFIILGIKNYLSLAIFVAIVICVELFVLIILICILNLFRK